MTASFNDFTKILAKTPVIPVVTVKSPARAVALARALASGGLAVIEVTLRTKAALDAIRAISSEVPEATVGAGTICHPRQIDETIRAGARFCVSPGATPSLLQCAADTGVKFLPGAVTPSEILTLLEWDITFLKFFPSEATGGVRVLKALMGPFPNVRFCPTGGIRPDNAGEYLALKNVCCVGGTWLCPPETLAREDWAHVESLARQAAALR